MTDATLIDKAEAQSESKGKAALSEKSAMSGKTALGSKYKAYREYKDSGVEWLGEIPSHWNCASVKRHFSVINGSTPKSTEAAFWNGDITWITPADLSKVDMNIDDSAKTITLAGLNSCGTEIVPAGSLILSTRAPIGSIAIAAKGLCTNQGCKSLVPFNTNETKFYFYVFSVSGKQLNNLGKGTTFLELSTGDLSEYKIPVPTDLERKHIANFLDHETAKIDKLIAKQQKLIALLKEKRQAVISHAVTKGLNPNVKMKDSGVEWLGKVPEHWKVTKLKYLVTEPLLYGANEAALDTDASNPRFIRITDVNADGSLKPDTFRSLKPEIAQPYMLNEGDILLARSGGTVGKSFIYRSTWGDCCFAGYLTSVSFKQ